MQNISYLLTLIAYEKITATSSDKKRLSYQTAIAVLRYNARMRVCLTTGNYINTRTFKPFAHSRLASEVKTHLQKGAWSPKTDPV